MALTPDLKRQLANPDQASNLWSELESQLQPVIGRLSEAQSQAFFRILGDSNFLARWARVCPEEVQNLLQDSWEETLDETALHRAWRARLSQHPVKDSSDYLNQMLRFKYYQLFRITLKDLGRLVPFYQTAGELSALACFMIRLALESVWNSWQDQWGVPVARSKSDSPIPFTILALGKLGGRELNYSSDVDIVYLYGTDQGRVLTSGRDTGKTPHQFFSKIGQELGKLLSQKNSEGFLYRVDLELRPEGKSGALANSLSAMENYYESFGAFWEKQALIKCGCAAGDRELFQLFHKMIEPFTFPKTRDFTLIEKIQEMKAKVEASVQQSNPDQYHVKLGPGGIREVEFFVQTLQILYGGYQPELRTPNTLEALQALKQAKLLLPEDEDALRRAYIFLRTLEHRLQLVEEQQTHRLPAESEAMEKLARRMGYLQSDAAAAAENLMRDLESHRGQVESRFRGLLKHRGDS